MIRKISYKQLIIWVKVAPGSSLNGWKFIQQQGKGEMVYIMLTNCALEGSTHGYSQQNCCLRYEMGVAYFILKSRSSFTSHTSCGVGAFDFSPITSG